MSKKTCLVLPYQSLEIIIHIIRWVIIERCVCSSVKEIIQTCHLLSTISHDNTFLRSREPALAHATLAVHPTPPPLLAPRYFCFARLSPPRAAPVLGAASTSGPLTRDSPPSSIHRECRSLVPHSTGDMRRLPAGRHEAFMLTAMAV